MSTEAPGLSADTGGDPAAGDAVAEAGGDETQMHGVATHGRVHRLWDPVRVPALLWAKVYAALFIVSWLSIELLERHPAYPKGPAVFRGTNLLEGWVRWDGNWYQLIATEGYFYTPGRQSSVAFFPAYPLTMKIVNLVVRDVFLSAVLVSLVCGFLAVMCFYRWCERRSTPPVAKVAVTVLVLYPYAWYLFGATYADALFLVATIGAFVLLDRDRPVLAGMLGIVATAARPVGAGVAVGLVCVLLEQRGIVTIPALERVKAGGWRAFRHRDDGNERTAPDTTPRDEPAADPPAFDAPEALGEPSRGFLGVHFAWRRLRARDLGVLLAPLGLVAWCLYLYRGWGNPFLFAEAESAQGWDQAAGPATWFKYEWLQNLGRLPSRVHDTIWPKDVANYRAWTEVLYTVGITVQFAFVMTALALVPRVLRRVGWGYALFVLCVVAVPLLGSKDFQGTGRYMLAAFPAFFVAGEWFAEHRTARRRWLPISTVGLVYLTSLFARGYYVA